MVKARKARGRGWMKLTVTHTGVDEQMNKGRGRAERKKGLGEGLLGRLIPFTLLRRHIEYPFF